MKMNCFIKTAMFVLSVWLISEPVSAQYNQTVGAPSPEASAVIKNIATPVDYATGTVNVQIPLYTIASNGVNVPIALSYRTSGIKLEDVASWVGLGWNLSAGGRITRVVRGSADDNQTYGFKKKYSQINKDGEWSVADYDNFTDYDQGSSWDDKFYRAIHGYDKDNRWDTEADIFFFELPGKSGMFFISPKDGKCYCMPAQNIEITAYPPSNSEITSFTIRDTDGTQYQFGAYKELTSIGTMKDDNSGYDYKSRNKYTSGWMLSSITTVDHKEITFTYERGNDYQYPTYRHNGIFTRNPENPKIEQPTDDTFMTRITPSYLKSIQWEGNKMEFERQGTYRKDLTNAYALKKIKIINSHGDSINNFIFHQSYFPRIASGNVYEFHLRLDKITMKRGANEDLIGQFDYISVNNEVARSSRDYDHWGYYNQAYNGTKNFPSVMKNDNGASREPSLSGSQMNSLRKIFNGTSGYTEFEYELHNGILAPHNSSTSSTVGGIRIKKITKYDGAKFSSVRYEYTKDNGYGNLVTSGTIYHSTPDYTRICENNVQGRFSYHISNTINNIAADITGNTVIYSQVKEIMPNGAYTVRKYRDHAEFPDFAGEYVQVAPASGTYVYNERFLPKTSRAYLRSLLKEEIGYSSNGETISRIEYTYKDDGPKTEINSYAPFTVKYASAYHYNNYAPIAYKIYNKYRLISQPVLLKTVKVYQGPYNLPSTTTYEYDMTYLVPRKVTVTNNADNTVTETRYKYPFDYPELSTLVKTNNIYGIRVMGQKGIYTPIETTVVKKGKVISHEIALYKACGASYDIPTLWKKYSLVTANPIPEGNFSSPGITDAYLQANPSYVLDVENTAHDQDGFPTYSVNYTGKSGAVVYNKDKHVIARIDNIAKPDIPDPTTSYTYTSRTDNISSMPSGGIPIGVSHDQYVNFSFTNNSPNTTPSYSSIRITITQYEKPSIVHTVTVDYTEPLNFQIPYPFSPYMAKGTYYAVVRAYNSSGQEVSISSFSGSLKISKYNLSSTVPTYTKNMLYTGFEDDQSNVSTSYPVSGRYARITPYTISLSDFVPGNYILTYWYRYPGISFSYRNTEKITITSTSTTKTINASTSAYLDDVSLIPEGARITTYTYRPAIGKASETDHNGNYTRWYYDDFGRISSIYTNDRMVKSYDYNMDVLANPNDPPQDAQGVGRNLLLNSGVPISNSSYPTTYYLLSEPLIEGQQYTVQIKGVLGDGKTDFRLYNSPGAGVDMLVSLTPSTRVNGVYTATFLGKASREGTDKVLLYPIANTVTSVSSVEWIKLEKGTQATPWSPAPEDVISPGDVVGRNLLLNSGVPVQNTTYNIANYTFSEPLIEGQQYTVQIKGVLGEGKIDFRLFNSTTVGADILAWLTPATCVNGIYTATFTGKPGSGSNTHIRIYTVLNTVTSTSSIEWIKLEKGTQATPWIPAPEDAGGHNLCPNTDVNRNGILSSWLPWPASAFSNMSHTVGSFIRRVRSTGSSASYGIQSPLISGGLKSGQQYTVSMEISNRYNTTNLNYNYIMSPSLGNKRLDNTFTIPSPTGDFHRVFFTFTADKDYPDARILIGSETGNDAYSDQGFAIRNFKVEKGTQATPWCDQ